MHGRASALLTILALLALSPDAHAAVSAPGDTTSTVILAADFNADVVGQAPDITLPGAPAGDFLTLNQAAGTVEVASSIDGLTNQPVLLKQNNSSGGVGLFAWSAIPPPGLERVTVRWRSLARDDNPATLLRCALRSAGGAILASIEYRPHGVLTFNSVGGGVGPTLPVEYQQNRNQQFTIVADLLTGTASLTIDGAPVAGFQDVPFPEPASGFALVGFEGEGEHPQSLVVDEISAVALSREPDQAPVVTAPPTAMGAEAALLAFGVSASDPDGEAIASLAASPLPTGAAFVPNGSNTAGDFSWTPGFGQAGSYSVTFTASNALTGSAATEITIEHTDRAPIVAAPTGINGEEGGTLDFFVTAEDPDGDVISSLTASLGVLPVGNSATFTPNFDNTSGEFYWPLKPGEAGEYTVTFSAAAGGLTGTAQTVVTVAVGGVSVTGQLIWTPSPGSELVPHFVTFTAVDQFGDMGQSVTEIVVTAPLGAAAPLPAGGAAAPSPGLRLSPGVLQNIQKGPVVSSPSKVNATVAKPVVVVATATDTTGGTSAASAPVLALGRVSRAGSTAGGAAANLTLTADLSQLGGNAVFLVDKDPVVNAPVNVSGDVASPIQFNVGADDPDGDPIVSLTADFTGFPSGNQPSFTVNGSNTIAAFAWTPGVSDSGDYEAFFTATNQLVGRAATRIHVRGVAPARVFMPGNKKIRLRSNKASDCVLIEPVDGSFDLTDIDLPTIRMTSAGTGSVSSIAPIAKSAVIGDRDNNMIQELTVCFSKGDLRLLFSDLNGNNTVQVSVGGSLGTGGLFSGVATITVVAGGGGNLAAVSPNPLNPAGVLSFSTERAGPVRVKLFDSGGRLVRELMDARTVEAGDHEILLDGLNSRGQRLASGVYFYRVETVQGVQNGRFAVMK